MVMYNIWNWRNNKLWNLRSSSDSISNAPSFFYSWCKKPVGYGMVLWNEAGGFIGAKTACYRGSDQVKVLEAVGLLEALSWTASLGYRCVEFELEAKCVVDVVLGTHEDLMEFDSIIGPSRRALQEERDFKVKFIWRQANDVA
ncbi:hypothetical protein PTKIN_Ptkin01aG0318400 [Pterospermum kingtungense]